MSKRVCRLVYSHAQREENMKKFLVILGIVLLNSPAALAADLKSGSNARRYHSDRSAVSTSYSAGKFNLGSREGVPPGNAPRR